MFINKTWINVVIYTDFEKTQTERITVPFVEIGYTESLSRYNVAQKIETYTDNPYVKEVKIVEESIERL